MDKRVEPECGSGWKPVQSSPVQATAAVHFGDPLTLREIASSRQIACSNGGHETSLGSAMNKTFAGVMAGVTITGAVLLALLLVLALLLGQVQFSWGDAWTLIRGVFVLALLIFSVRFFLARSRQIDGTDNVR